MNQTKQDCSFEYLAVAYLAAPAVLFLAIFLPWPLQLAPLLGACPAIYALREFRLHPRTLIAQWPLLVLAVSTVWVSGALPFFAENWDWVKHYAVFNTLADNPWPPVIQWDGADYQLRYTLGWYVVPGIVGKAFGFGAMQFAVLLWSALGIWIALVLAFRDKKHTVWAALVFLFFSGADIIGTWWTHFSKGPPLHIEWWAEFGTMSSNMTSVLWAPQHAIAAWLSVFLFFFNPRFSVRHGALIGVSLALWSPFAVLGLLPFAIRAAISNLKDTFSWQNILIGGLIGLPALVFLTSGVSDLPLGFSWNDPKFNLQISLGFIALEFGLIALALLMLRPGEWPLITLLLIVQIAFVFVYGGEANDLLMRGVLPAWTILSAMSASELVQAKNWRAIPLGALFAIGCITPMGEVVRSFTSTRIIDPQSISLNDLLAGEMSKFSDQYLVPKGAE